jgi:glycine hydroxymethyltransferase
MDVKTSDSRLFSLIEHEEKRQEEELNLIASENYASQAVMAATGSILTNKYAEGYPGKRYYGGCGVIDTIEQLAIDRCKELFGAEHANVQPHSGCQANAAVYFAALKPGDTILGMSLAAGGHLTHGHAVSASGTYFNAMQYGVDRETERIDYDVLAQLAEQHKPKLIIVGASAYSRTIDFQQCSAIARRVGALLMADVAHIAGLIAAKLHPTPVGNADFITSTTHKTLRGPRGGLIMCSQEWADRIDRAIMPGIQGGPLMNTIAAKAVAFHEALQPSFVTYQKQILANAKALVKAFKELDYRIVSGGTDNHLFILDLRSKNITGRAAETALAKAGIAISRSCIPFDTEKPWITSGIRLGTPALTTRGMKEAEMTTIAHLIDEVINNHTNDAFLASIKKTAQTFCKKFPIQQADPTRTVEHESEPYPFSMLV